MWKVVIAIGFFLWLATSAYAQPPDPGVVFRWTLVSENITSLSQGGVVAITESISNTKVIVLTAGGVTRTPTSVTCLTSECLVGEFIYTFNDSIAIDEPLVILDYDARPILDFSRSGLTYRAYMVEFMSNSFIRAAMVGLTALFIFVFLARNVIGMFLSIGVTHTRTLDGVPQLEAEDLSADDFDWDADQSPAQQQRNRRAFVKYMEKNK